MLCCCIRLTPEFVSVGTGTFEHEQNYEDRRDIMVYHHNEQRTACVSAGGSDEDREGGRFEAILTDAVHRG